MLQALLADRFELVLRRESKELPIYALVLARKDGKLGPSLRNPGRELARHLIRQSFLCHGNLANRLHSHAVR